MINLLFTISTAEGGVVILLEDLIISDQLWKSKNFLASFLLFNHPNQTTEQNLSTDYYL
jgi:hypothetical protein